MRAVPMSRCMPTTTRESETLSLPARNASSTAQGIDDETAKLMAEHDVRVGADVGCGAGTLGQRGVSRVYPNRFRLGSAR